MDNQISFKEIFTKKIQAVINYIKHLDDKEPIHTFYYLLGCGILIFFFLSITNSYFFANIITVLYSIVYFGFYIYYNGKECNRKRICFRALVMDIVISFIVLQILLFVK